MGVTEPPHCPTEEELRAYHELNLGDGIFCSPGMLGLMERSVTRREYHDALHMLQALVLERPLDADVYRRFARVYQRMGALHHAETCFAHALELEPRDAGTLVNVGELAWLLHRNAPRARRHFDAALALAPGPSERARVQAGLARMERDLRHLGNQLHEPPLPG